MKRILALLILICLPTAARAMWADVPVEELVQESDLIVVGTLRDVREHSDDGTDYGEGFIDVREVIWGGVRPGDALTLKWENSSAVVCPRVEHRHHADKEGIWLLTREGGDVRADYPGRFVGLEERPSVLRALRRSTVMLSSGDPFVGGGLPMTFELVYRNTTGATLRFPGVGRDGGGRALLPRGSRLAVRLDNHGEPKPVRLAARDAAGDVEAVTLAPGEERRFAFDLRELLAAEAPEGEIFIANFTPPGGRPTNEIVFYTDVRETFRLTPPPPPAPGINYERRYVAPAAGHGLTPPARAGLAALVSLLLFPFFYRLRASLANSRLARAAHGVQTWQI